MSAPLILLSEASFRAQIFIQGRWITVVTGPKAPAYVREIQGRNVPLLVWAEQGRLFWQENPGGRVRARLVGPNGLLVPEVAR